MDETEWTGINALLYYGPSLMHSIGLQGDTVELICSGGVGIAQFIASVPAIAWIDRLGGQLRLFIISNYYNCLLLLQEENLY